MAITKEEFNHWIPQRHLPRVNFIRETLRRFSVETARQKNTSFAYLLNTLASL